MSDQSKGGEVVLHPGAATADAAERGLGMHTGGRVAPIVPRTVEEVAYIAKRVIIAGLAPDSYQVTVGADEEKLTRTRARIMIGIMKGAEVGLPPMAALNAIAIINNRPCIWGDGALALLYGNHAVEWVKEAYEGKDADKVEIASFPDDYTAVFTIKRKGIVTPFVGRFSVREAKRAKLWGSTRKPWLEHPATMLMWRARGRAIRLGFADLLMGLSLREEVEDMPPEPKRIEAGILDDAPIDTSHGGPDENRDGSHPTPQHESHEAAPPSPPPDNAGPPPHTADSEPDAPGKAQASEGDPVREPPAPEAYQPGEVRASDFDWASWSNEQAKRIEACRTAEAVVKLRDELRPMLEKAPPAAVGHINRRFREAGKRVAGRKE